MIDPRITERIGSFYGAHFDPVAEKFMETNDHGVLPDEDERANAALRGAQFALSLAPQPVVDREALASAYIAFRERNGGCSEGPDCAACRRLAEEEADVAMALVRPMPTREAIDALLQEWRVGPAFRPPDPDYPSALSNYRRKLRNAVLALLTGSAK